MKTTYQRAYSIGDSISILNKYKAALPRINMKISYQT